MRSNGTGTGACAREIGGFRCLNRSYRLLRALGGDGIADVLEQIDSEADGLDQLPQRAVGELGIRRIRLETGVAELTDAPGPGPGMVRRRLLRPPRRRGSARRWTPGTPR